MPISSVERDGTLRNLHALSREKSELVDAALHPMNEEDLDARALEAAIRRYKRGEYSFERLVTDSSTQHLSFNILPGRQINEQVEPRCYFVGQDIARAVFDRRFSNHRQTGGPSHVSYVSALLQWQKLLYLWICHRTGRTYEAGKAETFRVLPTQVHCRMPPMMREESNLTQDAYVSRAEEIGPGSWLVEGFAIVNGRIGLIGRALIQDLLVNA